jgi:hypothetical protein
MQSATSLLKKYDPAVSKHWLLAVAGCMWAGVGVMLCVLAYGWLTHPATPLALACAVVGVLIALAANRFEFTRLALRNIDRILRYPDKVCVFAFQAWSGYVMIFGMIALGIVLRHSPLPKPYLAVIYVAIGGALIQASVNYFARLSRMFAEGDYLWGSLRWTPPDPQD